MRRVENRLQTLKILWSANGRNSTIILFFSALLLNIIFNFARSYLHDTRPFAKGDTKFLLHVLKSGQIRPKNRSEITIIGTQPKIGRIVKSPHRYLKNFSRGQRCDLLAKR